MKSSNLLKLVGLGLSSEQMQVVLEVLAAELAPMEALAAERDQRLLKDRLRKPQKVERGNSMETSEEIPRKFHGNSTETGLARVEDKPLPSSRIEISQQVTPCNPPPEPIDVARDAAELIEGWDRFWETYPKRAGSRDRQAALKAFRAARKRASIETIVAGARAYAAHCDDTGKAGTEFIKQARTWLNGNGWEEDYRHARQPSKPTHGSALRNAFEEQRADLAARFGEPDAVNQGP